jgi:hypothetical protein
MCYMNVQKERESDPENFGARITKVLGLFLGIFLRLGTFLELFFNFLGLTAKIPNRGLIIKKLKGFFAKMLGITEF